MSRNVLAIHKSIGYILLYYPGSAGGRVHGPELFSLCFFMALGWAAVWLELPLHPNHEVIGPLHYPDRVVFGRPHYARKVWAMAPLRRTKAAIFILGNSWLGV